MLSNDDRGSHADRNQGNIMTRNRSAGMLDRENRTSSQLSLNTIESSDGQSFPADIGKMPRCSTPPPMHTISSHDMLMEGADFSKKPVDPSAVADRKHGPSPSWIQSPRSSKTAKKTNSQRHDRFIPDNSLRSPTTARLLNGEPFGSPSKSKNKAAEIDIHQEEIERAYNHVLRGELFGSAYSNKDSSPRKQLAHSTSSAQTISEITPNSRQKLLDFHPNAKKPPSARKLDFTKTNPMSQMFSQSPISVSSQKALLSPRKPPRNISKTPFKVLDAPELADDFYLNVVDWGSTNILGVGLGSAVYLWSACTSKVTKLCDLGPYDSVTSINWAEQGSQLAIGTNRGTIQLWDAARCKMVRSLTGHNARVGSLAWNSSILSSGSRDRSILHRDVRAPRQFVRKLTGHRQEVCGLRWNTSENQLASGGNDNKLFVWDRMEETPLYKLASHTAAVKAIAWSPHQRGILASGGGTADRRIKFWNTQTGTLQQSIDTGSQVCNLSWSMNSNEIVSTHGYSQNQISVWKYPSMQQVATLTGHTYRVLYLAMSPDGQTIVTGAGDETLRFWNVFAKRKTTEAADNVLLGSPRTIR